MSGHQIWQSRMVQDFFGDLTALLHAVECGMVIDRQRRESRGMPDFFRVVGETLQAFVPRSSHFGQLLRFPPITAIEFDTPVAYRTRRNQSHQRGHEGQQLQGSRGLQSQQTQREVAARPQNHSSRRNGDQQNSQEESRIQFPQASRRDRQDGYRRPRNGRGQRSTGTSNLPSPVVHGHQATRHLRQRTSSIPQAPVSSLPTDADVEICAICLEQFAEKDTLSQLSCEHLFHRSCARRWLRRSETCPTCRNSVFIL